MTDRRLDSVRSVLGAELADAALTAGRAMSVDAAIAKANTDPNTESRTQRYEAITLTLAKSASVIPIYNLESIVVIERGVDGLADADEGFEQACFQPQLLVEPGVVNDLGCLRAEFLQ